MTYYVHTLKCARFDNTVVLMYNETNSINERKGVKKWK